MKTVNGPFQVTVQANGKLSIFTDHGQDRSMADEVLVDWDIDDERLADEAASQPNLVIRTP